MKVFISWSGERSKLVAEILNWWIRSVIQAVRPWMSTEIDRGALWFPKINDELAQTEVGVVCLTKENLDKRWILFEAGALAKGLSSNRVCTLLIDLQPNDLQSPLSQFNHTLPTETGMWSLISTINSALKDLALPHELLQRAYTTYWPPFKKAFDEAISNTKEGPQPEVRNDSDMLIELLSGMRALNSRMSDIETAIKPTIIDEGKSKPIHFTKFSYLWDNPSTNIEVSKYLIKILKNYNDIVKGSNENGLDDNTAA